MIPEHQQLMLIKVAGNEYINALSGVSGPNLKKALVLMIGAMFHQLPFNGERKQAMLEELCKDILTQVMNDIAKENT